MGILRDFEQRLEGAVEGFFARAFRSGLQPVELAKAIQRYASNHKHVGVDGVVVPNAYRISLAEEDADRLQGYGEALRHELAGVVHRTARERGWRLKGPVRVETIVDDRLKVGTYELRGKVEASAPQPAPAGRQAGPPPREQGWEQPVTEATQSIEAQPPAEAALIRAHDGNRVALRKGSTLGRLPTCDVTLDDPSVSRRHARIDCGPDGWTVEDLGSTNGIKVNGRRLDRTRLFDGDELQLGNVRLTFTAGGSP